MCDEFDKWFMGQTLEVRREAYEKIWIRVLCYDAFLAGQNSQDKPKFAVYKCDLAWQDKGGPDGERWEGGRYFIEHRGEASLFKSKSEAELAMAEMVKKECKGWKTPELE